jgi:hypothetical protein
MNLRNVGNHSPILTQPHILEEQIPEICVCVETGFWWFIIRRFGGFLSVIMNLWEAGNVLSSKAISGSKSLKKQFSP